METGNPEDVSSHNPENYSNKMQELLNTNYKSLFKQNTLVDYRIRDRWRVGEIINDNGNTVEVRDFCSPSEYETIRLSDKSRISYFRKYTKATNNYYLYERGTSSDTVLQLKVALDTILTKYAFDNPNTMNNENAYHLMCIYRGKLFYYLDFLLNERSDFEVDDIDIVVQNIKKYLLIIKKLFEFYRNNNELLRNYDAFRGTEYEDIIVIDWKYAIISSFQDSIIMLRKILGRDEMTAPFYIKYKREFKKIIVDKSKKDLKNGIKVEIPPKRCIPNAYEAKVTISLRGFNIPAFSIAYLTDYFFYIEGYKTLSDVIISNSSYSLVLVDLFLVPFFDAYLLANNFKDVLQDEIEIIRKYVYNLIEKMSEVDIKENSKDRVMNIIKKVVTIYPVKDGGVFEGMYLIYYYRLFMCKTLEKQILAMNKFNEIINTVEYRASQIKSGNGNVPVRADLDQSIVNLTFEQLAIFFNEKGIVDILFGEKIHDEIFKRSIKIMKLMYSQNWCMKDKEQSEKYSTEIFDKLWIKGFSKKSSKNDESFTEWVKDYICEFCEVLSDEHKIYFFKKIQIYVKEGPITKENIIFLRNFTLKCINKANIQTENEDSNLLDDDHLYGLKLIWEYMQDEQDNAAQSEDNFSLFSQSQNKNDIITECINSLKIILSSPTIEDEIRKAILTQSFVNIKAHNSIIQTLELIKHLCVGSQFEERYIQILQKINMQLNLIDTIVDDLIRYIHVVKSIEVGEAKIEEIETTVYEGMYHHSYNILIRMQVIMMLCNKKRQLDWNFENFLSFWKEANSEQCAKLTLYRLLTENISNINNKLFDDFFNKIILNEEQFSINSAVSFNLFKVALYEINLRNKKFMFIGNSRSSLRIQSDQPKIEGIEKLWYLLLNESTSDDIKNEVSNLLCDLCLNLVSFKNESQVVAYWNRYISQLGNELIQAVSGAKDEKAIKGLLILIKRISDKTGDPGVIATEGDIDLKNSTNIDKNGCCIFTFIKTNGGTAKTLKVGNKAPFHITRYELSYYFKIPVNNVVCIIENKKKKIIDKKEVIEVEAKKFDLNNDFDEANSLFLNKNNNDSNNGVSIVNNSDIIIKVNKEEHPILRLSTNPKKMLLEEGKLNSIFGVLLRDKDKSYITEVWELVKLNKGENKEYNNRMKLLCEIKQENEDKEMIDEINNKFDFDTTSIYYVSYVLNHIKYLLSSADEKFIKETFLRSYIWNEKIKKFFVGFTMIDSKAILNEKIEKINCMISLIEILRIIHQSNKDNQDSELLLQKVSQFLYEIVNFSINNADNSISKNEIECANLLLSFIQNEILFEFISFVNKDFKNNQFYYVLNQGELLSNNATIKQKLSSFLNVVLERCLDKKDKDESHKTIIKDFFDNLIVNLVSKENLEKIAELKLCKSSYIDKYFSFIENLINSTFCILGKKYSEMENEFCYQKLINEYILDKLAEGKVSEEVIAGLLRIIYAICSNMSIEFKKMKLKKDYNESGIVIRIEESEEEEEKKENENKDINQEFVREEEKKKEDEVKIKELMPNINEVVDRENNNESIPLNEEGKKEEHKEEKPNEEEHKEDIKPNEEEKKEEDIKPNEEENKEEEKPNEEEHKDNIKPEEENKNEVKPEEEKKEEEKPNNEEKQEEVNKNEVKLNEEEHKEDEKKEEVKSNDPKEESKKEDVNPIDINNIEKAQEDNKEQIQSINNTEIPQEIISTQVSVSQPNTINSSDDPKPSNNNSEEPINQIVNNQKEDYEEIDFITFILDRLLLSKCNEVPLFHSSPKCNLLSSSKLSAYHLLVLLSFTDEKKRIEILNRFAFFHSLEFWKSNESVNWRISSVDLSRTLPYIGIKNLGCTCYMNSLFQIFYNIPSFRESIMKCECPNEKKNSLFQLKKLFFSLKYSESQFCDALDFCKNFDDRVLNTHEQMDIDEFFVILLDKIEEHLKGTKNADLVKYFFQGKNSDELLFQNSCNHNRENELSFYSFQLQVKNKKSIEESLDAIIEGELMDGDNKIFCDFCKTKHPAIKRQSFKTLPRMLIFVLKRFEFNYDTMQKIKLNDYYEFPLTLDMTKYTTEYLHNKNENKSKENKANQYRLKGIVIHTGHSEGGHYYAFIRDQNSENWYEFNDTRVRPFDIKNLKEEAFGGFEIRSDGTKVERSRNAYLLFYEKLNEEQCVQFDKVNFKANRFDNYEIIQKINNNMFHYHIQNNIFSKEYHMFILEFTLNLLNLGYGAKELKVFVSYFAKNQDNNIVQSELLSLRDIGAVGSNINNYLLNGSIYLHQAKEKQKLQNEFIIQLFEFLIQYFFNVLLRSNDKSFQGGTIDLIKFFLNQYPITAEYLLEEFANYEVQNEYLIFCPIFETKKIIVGILYCAMLSLENAMQSSSAKQDAELRRMQREHMKLKISELSPKDRLIEDNIDDMNDIPGILTFLQEDNIPQSTLKLVNNVLHTIAITNNPQDSMFLYYLLSRYASISSYTKKSLVYKAPLLEYINIILFQSKNPGAITQAANIINTSYAPPSHGLLITNYVKDIGPLQQNDYMYHNEDYGYLLLFTLLSVPNYKSKHQVFTFDNINYLAKIFDGLKTKQNTYAMSQLVNQICYDNKKMLTMYIKIFSYFIENKDPIDFDNIMIVLKRLIIKGSEASQERIKTILDAYLKVLFKLDSYYAVMDYHIQFITDLFIKYSTLLYPYVDYYKSYFNKMIRWYKENPIPPKLQPYRNIAMYMTKEVYYQDYTTATIKEFENKSIIETKEKLEKLNMILNKEIRGRVKVYDGDIDLTDFKFLAGDVVYYQLEGGSKVEATVIEATDEMIEIEFENSIRGEKVMQRKWISTDSPLIVQIKELIEFLTK